MRLFVRHEIALLLAPPANSAIGVARLQPRACDSQQVARWSVDLDHDCALSARADAYGNACQAFHAEGPLERLTITASGEVSTFDTAGLVRGTNEPFPTELFLRETALTAADAALRSFAARATASARSLLDKPHMLMRALSATVAPGPASGGGAGRAFAARAGDARDVAHLMIAGARSVGLPARIAAGYLIEAPGRDTHAWAEIFVEGHGWIGFDATICLCMHEGHVALARGLDFSDVDPLRTAFHGRGAFRRVTRLAVSREEIAAFAPADAAAAQAAAQSQS